MRANLRPSGAGDGSAERGLAHARRPDEAQDGALQAPGELQHGQVIEDAVLDLFQVVVVLVEDLGGVLDVHRRAGRNAPGQAGHPFQVGARDAVFGRSREMRARRFELAQGLGLDLLGHAGGFQLLAQILDVARGFVALAELLLDGLQLLAQIELALALRELALHLRLDAAAQLQQLALAREVAQTSLRRARPSVCSSSFWRSPVRPGRADCRRRNRPVGRLRRSGRRWWRGRRTGWATLPRSAGRGSPRSAAGLPLRA